MDFNKSLLLIVSLSSLLLSASCRDLPVRLSPSSAPTPSEGNNLFDALFQAGEQVFKPAPQVIEFCAGTENPALCAQTIAPFMTGSFDPLKALETEIEATLNQSLKVVSSIDLSLSDPTTTKDAFDVLDICQKNYQSIVDTIKEAEELLNQQNVVDAYYKFNSVLSDRSSCEDAFGEAQGVDNPFADDSLTVYQLGGNCMAIMDGLVNNRNGFLV